MKQIIDGLFRYYCERIGRTERYALTEKRRRACELRLKEFQRYYGKTLEDAEKAAREAIDNLAGSDWHRENGHVDWLEQIFRGFEEFEKRWTWSERRAGYVANRTAQDHGSSLSEGEDEWSRAQRAVSGIRETTRRDR
jgi:hypothetical protein